jgi:hypothetical protein
MQEFISPYGAPGTGKGKMWYLFHMDEDTGIPEEEQVRYRPMFAQYQLTHSRALVLREDELKDVEVEVRNRF